MAERQKWVEKDHLLLSVRQQCDMLELNRSNLYYVPQAKILSEKQRALLHLIDEVYTQYPFFGSRQMSDYISLHEYPCKRHEVRWAYETIGLRSLAPGPHTSKPHPEHKIYPYLLHDIEIIRPCQVFSTDVAILIRTRKVEYYEAENSNVKTDHQNIPFRI